MEQLVMLAKTPFKKATHTLPDGYKFVKFDGSEKDIAAWKTIEAEPPAPIDGVDACYNNAIANYHYIDLANDVFFVEDENGQRVATFTVITQQNGMGYLHMVKAMNSQRGKGIGHFMAQKSIEICEERGLESIILTTDDFRLPAIKTYLDAGYYPVVYGEKDNEVNTRWDKVLAELNYPEVIRYNKD